MPGGLSRKRKGDTLAVVRIGARLALEDWAGRAQVLGKCRMGRRLAYSAIASVVADSRRSSPPRRLPPPSRFFNRVLAAGRQLMKQFSSGARAAQGVQTEKGPAAKNDFRLAEQTESRLVSGLTMALQRLASGSGSMRKGRPAVPDPPSDQPQGIGQSNPPRRQLRFLAFPSGG